MLRWDAYFSAGARRSRGRRNDGVEQSACQTPGRGAALPGARIVVETGSSRRSIVCACTMIVQVGQATARLLFTKKAARDPFARAAPAEISPSSLCATPPRRIRRMILPQTCLRMKASRYVALVYLSPTIRQRIV